MEKNKRCIDCAYCTLFSDTEAACEKKKDFINEDDLACDEFKDVEVENV